MTAGRYAVQMVGHGRNRGTMNGSAKLNEHDVRQIRSSQLTRRELADRYQVGIYTIRDIRQFRTWSWLDD